MTKKSKQKHSFLLIKLAEIKYILKELKYDTTHIDLQIEEIKNNIADEFILHNRYSLYSQLIETKYYLNKLKVYKQDKKKKDFLLDVVENIIDQTQSHPEWKVTTVEETK